MVLKHKNIIPAIVNLTSSQQENVSSNPPFQIKSTLFIAF